MGSLEESLSGLRRDELPLLQNRVDSLSHDKTELQKSVERLTQELEYGKGKLAESEVRLSRTSDSLDSLRVTTDQEALTNKTVMRSLEERLAHSERTRMAAEQREHSLEMSLKVSS